MYICVTCYMLVSCLADVVFVHVLCLVCHMSVPCLIYFRFMSCYTQSITYFVFDMIQFIMCRTDIIFNFNVLYLYHARAISIFTLLLLIVKLFPKKSFIVKLHHRVWSFRLMETFCFAFYKLFAFSFLFWILSLGLLMGTYQVWKK